MNKLLKIVPVFTAIAIFLAWSFCEDYIVTGEELRVKKKEPVKFQIEGPVSLEGVEVADHFVKIYNSHAQDIILTCFENITIDVKDAEWIGAKPSYRGFPKLKVDHSNLRWILKTTPKDTPFYVPSHSREEVTIQFPIKYNLKNFDNFLLENRPNSVVFKFIITYKVKYKIPDAWIGGSQVAWEEIRTDMGMQLGDLTSQLEKSK